ncbi:MAG: ABC transporter ATP-binding protein [Clostridia bacterium]|nr:ABC transporter ATP-binding protein [Clostridia bacterium]
MLKRIIGCIREYKKPTILTFVFIVGEAIIETLIPFITAQMIDRIQKAEGDMMSSILKSGLLLVLMAMLSLVFGGVAAVTSAKASAGFAKNLRSDVFDKIQTYSFENIDKFSSASLVTRMTHDITEVQFTFMMAIRIAVRAPLMLIFSVVMGIVMGGKMALTFLVVIPILGGGFFLISQKAMPVFRRIFRKYDAVNESIEENVRGMRVVKSFAREGYEKAKFADASEGLHKNFTFAERIVALNTPLMQLCVYFNMVFIVFVGAKIAISTGGTVVNVGEISAMLTYGFQILMQLMMLGMIYVTMSISAEALHRIGEVLGEQPRLVSPKNAVREVRDGSITFENVSFRYAATSKKDTLSGLDLRIESGMTVGILGGTGSGKSSFVQLIPRLYDVSEGRVTVGGLDVREYDLETLRNAVAMVLQKNLLFSGTIRENLRWGNENATDEELVEACKLAQADEFIRSFPEGYDTFIEQGGTNVSGGQKQRLCIARALLKKPKILILDDSTSAVDTRTDALIRAGFRSYIPETTKLIIAQRVTSVMDADIILLLDGGRIVASGTHEQLLAGSEIYREIYTEQTNRGDEQ